MKLNDDMVKELNKIYKELNEIVYSSDSTNDVIDRFNEEYGELLLSGDDKMERVYYLLQYALIGLMSDKLFLDISTSTTKYRLKIG